MRREARVCSFLFFETMESRLYLCLEIPENFCLFLCYLFARIPSLLLTPLFSRPYTPKIPKVRAFFHSSILFNNKVLISVPNSAHGPDSNSIFCNTPAFSPKLCRNLRRGRFNVISFCNPNLLRALRIFSLWTPEPSQTSGVLPPPRNR